MMHFRRVPDALMPACMLHVLGMHARQTPSLVPCGSIFSNFSGHADGERRGFRSNRRVASERSRQDAPLGTFRSTRVLGVRRRHAPRYREKNMHTISIGEPRSRGMPHVHCMHACKRTHWSVPAARSCLDSMIRPQVSGHY